MKVNDKISALRDLMNEHGFSAYIIPSSDAHLGEYVAEHWQARQWISGFTGSAGTVVVTLEKAGLWADGRYFIQAENQIKNTEIELFKIGIPGFPTYTEWLLQELQEGDEIGIDGSVFSVNDVKNMQQKFDKKNISIISHYDLIAEIWQDRPSLPTSQVFLHDVKFAGKSRKEKIEMIRAKMKKQNLDYHLFTSLDDIAWTFNIRANDIKYSPVSLAFAVIGLNSAHLFIDKNKIKNIDLNNVEIHTYEKITEFLSNLEPEKSILIDPNKTNIKLKNAIPKDCKIIEKPHISTLLKSIKNETEIANLKKCQIRDGVAMVRFLYWLDSNIGKIKITEMSAAEKLAEIRAKDENFVDLSFNSISAYMANAAMMHYAPSHENETELKPAGFYLIDSGGNYLDGTTDITRTVCLGNISHAMKRDFTLVLKSHIDLSLAHFLEGATGANLDILARHPMWQEGLDYKCGTGHGVGYFLNVHEGPQNFSQRLINVPIKPGMTTTNEPGIYKENEYGIRTENTLLCVEDQKTYSGQFYKFEVISFCPIDIRAILPEMLNESQNEWLNNYHNKVYKKLNSYLTSEEKTWLEEMTKPIS
ncbi:MAG: aminopeptidase P family protein [Candidatus Cloacimonetes bacterium]|nr:aminopeptidase P family protein [Candidatus Cloacimonadota bacterium]MCF7814611.1 aminopeptidase P family protein [Candidatus Cloacimonadota bacterium]MCF7868109.1 aminopeptidase P family protein [Candidatus Cloacimonadota bacterium]MCF7883575.1 aminopeptidase P family protein [Candidatus Cloacimonadota bacterium]